MRLTPYGRKQILIAGVCAAVPLCASLVLAAVHSPWWLLAAGVCGASWLAVAAFFRDPHRTPPPGEALWVSPADGRVADVTALDASGPLGEPSVRIGIFMSVLNVHVNRSPLDAEVVEIIHRDGVFLDARDRGAIERNESATIRLKTVCGGRERSIVVRQIAGRIARRIVTDLAPGRRLRRGERIGMIKFGSRLELHVPAEMAQAVRVGVGERVRSGKTVLLEVEPAPADVLTAGDKLE